MTDWAANVDQLLFDGETVLESLDVGEDRLYVTSHRLLAFMPTGDDPNFAAIHRPNVTGVEQQAGGATEQFERAVKAGLLGFFLIAGGATVSLDGVLDASVDSAAAGQAGIGQFLGMLDVLTMVLALVDEVMLVAGLFSLALTAVATTLYVRSRRTDVVVKVAGGDDILLTGEDVTKADLIRLRRALGMRGSEQREDPR